MSNKKRQRYNNAQPQAISHQFPKKPETHVYHFDSRMIYGKYEGYTLGEVIKINPGYIVWMHQQGMNVSKKLYDEASKALKQRHADNIRYQRAQLAIYPGNVVPEQCPNFFPEIDLLAIDGDQIFVLN
jgi:hypothetical protein